jgi:uncharacterized protein with LGFP repeats
VPRFVGGSIYWQKATGGWAVTGVADQRYQALQGPTGALGWPLKAAAARTGGTAQAFQNGDLYLSKAGTAAAVTGAVRTEYTARGGTSGTLGWPTADAVTTATAGGGTMQVFAGGRIYVRTAGAPVTLTGASLSTYLARGEVGGSLGWPTGAATRVTAHGRTGTVQHFTAGAEYLLSGRMYTVTGSLYRDYAAHQGPAGSLGWVTGVAHGSSANGGGWSQTFAGGTIYYSNLTKQAHPLSGSYLRLYNARGGVTGTLGWPGGKQAIKLGKGGSMVVFTSGRIYASTVGTVAVRGAILDKYLADKGPAGRLGWPKRNATIAGGVSTQAFLHGTITWSASAGAKVHLN